MVALPESLRNFYSASKSWYRAAAPIPGAAPAIAVESPQDKTPVDASGQERRRSSLPAGADTAVLAADLQRKARLGAQKINMLR
ncbi:MAG: hypothetical protein EA358_00460 [Flavobacteriales bacterium]|nr:MAG: hypothetical protein EA358_00460 [Flavobacteriales bacterium]